MALRTRLGESSSALVFAVTMVKTKYDVCQVKEIQRK